MKNKRTWNLLGFISGLLVVIVGVYCALGGLKDFPYPGYSLSGLDSYSFGADFYTEIYKAADAIENNTRITVNFVRCIQEDIARYTGIIFIIVGVLIAIHYGKEFFCEEKKAPVDKIIENIE